MGQEEGEDWVRRGRIGSGGRGLGQEEGCKEGTVAWQDKEECRRRRHERHEPIKQGVYSDVNRLKKAAKPFFSHLSLRFINMYFLFEYYAFSTLLSFFAAISKIYKKLRCIGKNLNQNLFRSII